MSAPVFNTQNRYLPLTKLSELSGVPIDKITVEQYRIAGVLPFYASNYKAPDKSNDSRVLIEIEKSYNGKKHKVFPYSADNELLEFHGDSALRLIIAEYLLTKYPGETEAFYSRVRINCEKKTTLVIFAQERGISGYSILSKNFEKLRGTMHVVEDLFEAFVSGLYHAFGYGVATFFVHNTLNNTKFKFVEDTNYKNLLIAAGSVKKSTTATYVMPPSYALQISSGKYKNGYVVFDRRIGKCIGAAVSSSKKKAKEFATREGLAYLIAENNGEHPDVSESVKSYLAVRNSSHTSFKDMSTK